MIIIIVIIIIIIIITDYYYFYNEPLLPSCAKIPQSLQVQTLLNYK